MSATLCVCGKPAADCEHLGVFKTYEEKARYYRAIDAANGTLDAVATRAGVKQAIALAQKAADEASGLPLGDEVKAALAFVVAALAKAAALAALE